MALSCIWRFWIALIMLSGTHSLGCGLLGSQNAGTLSRLYRMGGRLTQHCVTTGGTPQIPLFNLAEVTDNLNAEGKLLVIQQTLDQTSKIFTENLSTAPWDAARLEQFLIHLNQQLRELNACVSEPVSGSGSEEIQQFFRKLRELLELERFSDCAWNMVRRHIRASLQQIPAIIGKIR